MSYNASDCNDYNQFNELQFGVQINKKTVKMSYSDKIQSIS